MSNVNPLVRELIELKAQIAPLEEKFEAAKESIRAAGPETYTLPGLGTVKVAAAVERKAKGTQVALNAERLEEADKKLVAKLFALGILQNETIYTRASKSKVEVTVAEEIKKAA